MEHKVVNLLLGIERDFLGAIAAADSASTAQDAVSANNQFVAAQSRARKLGYRVSLAKLGDKRIAQFHRIAGHQAMPHVVVAEADKAGAIVARN